MLTLRMTLCIQLKKRVEKKCILVLCQKQGEDNSLHNLKFLHTDPLCPNLKQKGGKQVLEHEKERYQQKTRLNTIQADLC